MQPRSAYLHVPFCRHRCGYCNFTLVAGRDDLIDCYLDALEVELRQSLRTPQPVETLYIGGGTPTHLSPAQLRRLLDLAAGWFCIDEQAEFTVEANPADIDAPLIEILATAGVNRLSLGVQSFDRGKLKTLERDHDRTQVQRAVYLLRQRIPNFSMDLIFGVPGESKGTWKTDLRLALDAAPQHISAYGLTFERGTRFWSRRAKQELHEVDDADEVWMYEMAIDTIGGAGYDHYEVSSFARPGFRSRHNQVYWTGQEYFAAGPGAARFTGGRRETNHRSTTTYLRRIQAGESPVAETEVLSGQDLARERLVFGLRRLQGVHDQRFVEETGYTITQLVGDVLPRYLDQNWLHWKDGHLRLTRQGLIFSDGIWPDFL